MFQPKIRAQAVSYASYTSRLTKPSILGLDNSEDGITLKLLEKYGKKVTNLGGLEGGIIFDRLIMGKTLRNPSGFVHFIRQYRVIEDHFPEETFDKFAEFLRRLDQILSGIGIHAEKNTRMLERILSSNKPDPEADQVIKVLKKYGKKYEDQGGLANGIIFDNFKIGKRSTLMAPVLEGGTPLLGYAEYFWIQFRPPAVSISKVETFSQLNGEYTFATLKELINKLEKIIVTGEF